MVQEPIYKGATRPAMKFGIPLVPLVLLGGTSTMLVLWGGLLVSWWTSALVIVGCTPAILWMRLVTQKDDQRFRQMYLAGRLKARDRNHRLWESRSYSPYRYRGANDAWRR